MVRGFLWQRIDLLKLLERYYSGSLKVALFQAA